MSKIKRWASKRTREVIKTEPLALSTVTDFLVHLESEHGPLAAKAFCDIAKSHAPFIINKHAPDGKVLHFAEQYLTDRSFREKTLDGMASGFHRHLLAESMREFSRTVSDLLKSFSVQDVDSSLKKAVHKKDWTRISNKVNPDAHLTVDASKHVQQFQVHQPYKEMLDNKDLTFPHHKLDENGISAKMVHEIDEGHGGPELYMAKPYHKKIESATKSWVKNPILGWATMANKALYDAGKIGHLNEDVSAYEHEGVPLTVHRFSHGFKPVNLTARFERGNEVDPVDLHKIGVMDYLTNNLDRHGGNLMLGTSDNHNEQGYLPVLAIDHERSFQYVNHMRDQASRRAGKEYVRGLHDQHMHRENPLAYMRHQAAGQLLQGAKNNWHSHEQLTDWWTNHGRDIKSALEGQLEGIKDESVRNHVRDNFNSRWNKMNNWVDRMKSDPNSDEMFTHNALGDAFEDTRNIPQSKPRISANVLRALPRNKKDAMLAIVDMVNKKDRLTPHQHHLLSSAMDKVISSMTPEEAADTFRSVVDNPHASTKKVIDNPELNPRLRMLNHFHQAHEWDAGNNPIYKMNHMNAIANVIDSLPAEKRETMGEWADYYRSKMNRTREAV